MKADTAWCALVRNDKGGLEPRHFKTSGDAARISLDRELPAPAPLPKAAELAAVAGWKDRASVDLGTFARKLGLPRRTVRAVWKKGGLPGAVQHTSHTIHVPAHLLRLAQTYGLRRVQQMAAAGMI